METRIPDVGEVLVHQVRATGKEVHAIVVRGSEPPVPLQWRWTGKNTDHCRLRQYPVPTRMGRFIGG